MSERRAPREILSAARYFGVPLHCRPEGSAKSIHIDTGTANQRHRCDWLQDVVGRVRHMLTSGFCVDLFAGSDQSSFSSSHQDPHDEHPEGALPTLPHSRWKRDVLQPPQIQHIPDGGLRRVTWNAQGLTGSLTSPQLSREQKHKSFRRFIENNIICVEVHGKDEFLQAISVLAPRFRLYGAFAAGNANASGSAIRIQTDLLLDDAFCNTCDHLPPNCERTVRMPDPGNRQRPLGTSCLS